MARSTRLSTLLLCFVCAHTTGAQPAFLVKDGDPRVSGTRGSDPSGFVRSGRYAYFSATTPATGRELWRTDGTAAGTVLLADIVPGPDSGLVAEDGSELVDVGGTLFFTARNAWDGTELWKSDGTRTGTVRVERFEGNGACSWPRHLTNAGGVLYFTLLDRENHDAVWTSDGTESGTRLVRLRAFTGCDLANPASPCFPFRSVAFGKRLVFTDALLPRGMALVTTDGTASGTFEIARFQGIDLSGSSLAVAGGTLFFGADDGRSWALYASDGTAAGTRRLAEVVPFAPVALKGALLFWSLNRRDGNAPLELWRSDGTARGTVQLRVLFAQASWWFPPTRAVLGSVVAFVVEGSLGPELWTTDGTANGTRFVALVPSLLGEPAVVGETLFFRTAQQLGLWRTDGTPSGTRLASAVDASGLVALADRLIFANDDAEHGAEPWASDGTEPGTGLVADLDPSPNAAGLNPKELTDVGGTLLFTGGPDPGKARELWRSDGTEAGTTRVADLFEPISGLTSLGKLAVFVSQGGVWKTDGTFDGTTTLPAPAAFTPLVPLGRIALFGASSEWAVHRALWVTDGTVAGTFEITQCKAGPAELTAAGMFVYFTDGPSLWRSDGTREGTRRIEDFDPNLPAGPRMLTDVGGLLYFTAPDRRDGGLAALNLYRTGGTVHGASVLREFPFPGTAASSFGELRAVGGSLFFSILDESSPDRGLWKTDGAPESTVHVSSEPLPFGLTASGRLAYFGSCRPAPACVLWRSDGTRRGTFEVTSGRSSRASEVSLPGVGSGLQGIARGDGRLLFAATTAGTGLELWTTDGTAEGTSLVQDINPGPASALMNVPTFARSGDRIFFAADDGVHGAELWALPLASTKGPGEKSPAEP